MTLVTWYLLRPLSGVDISHVQLKLLQQQQDSNLGEKEIPWLKMKKKTGEVGLDR